MTSVGYPLNGPVYTYSFDSMGRPNKLTDNAPTPLDWVKDVLYGVAGQMTQMRYSNGVPGAAYNLETKTYNTRLQMTEVKVVDETGAGTTVMDMKYTIVDP